MRCPCTSGDSFDACCGPILSGASTAPTAERLMRSRFTAFATQDAAYLMRSWHPSTRPTEVELDSGIRWTRLDILDTSAGGPFDTAGIVAFEAFFRSDAGERASMRERSSFVREDRVWTYVGGTPY